MKQFEFGVQPYKLFESDFDKFLLDMKNEDFEKLIKSLESKIIACDNLLGEISEDNPIALYFFISWLLLLG